MKARQLAINQKIDLAVGTADSINMIALFSLFLNDVLLRFLEETGRFFMFPFSAMSGAIRAVLSWRQAKLDNGKHGTTLKAIVETVGALAISIAVIGGFVAASIFATIAPIIFTVTLAAKTLFHAGSAFYYWGKSVASPTQDKKQEYKDVARAHVVGTVALTFSTVAVGVVMLAAKPIFAILGIIAGVIGLSYSISNLAKTSTFSIAPKGYQILGGVDKSTENREKQDKARLSHSAILHQKLKTETHSNSLFDNADDKQITLKKYLKKTNSFFSPQRSTRREENAEYRTDSIFAKK